MSDEYKPLKLSGVEAELLEQRRQQVQAIARAVGVPPCCVPPYCIHARHFSEECRDCGIWRCYQQAARA